MNVKQTRNPMELYSKYRDKIDNFVLKGHSLKNASQAIQDNVKGTVKGLTAEVREDDSVLVYSLSYEGKVTKGNPYLKVSADGEVTPLKGRGITLEHIVPEGKSKGLLVSKTGKVTVPLLA